MAQVKGTISDDSTCCFHIQFSIYTMFVSHLVALQRAYSGVARPGNFWVRSMIGTQ